MLHVLLKCVAVYEDVINKHFGAVSELSAMQLGVHDGLKGCRAGFQAEWCTCIAVQGAPPPEGSQIPARLIQRELGETTAHIKLSEKLRLAQLVKHVASVGNGGVQWRKYVVDQSQV